MFSFNIFKEERNCKPEVIHCYIKDSTLWLKMRERESEPVRFLYYIISIPSHLYWEMFLSYLKEIQVKDKISCKKVQIHLLYLFCLEFSLSSLQQTRCTLFIKPEWSWMVSDFWSLQTLPLIKLQHSTYWRKQTSEERSLYFLLVLLDKCTLLFLQLTKEMEKILRLYIF